MNRYTMREYDKDMGKPVLERFGGWQKEMMEKALREANEEKVKGLARQIADIEAGKVVQR